MCFFFFFAIILVMNTLNLEKGRAQFVLHYCKIVLCQMFCSGKVYLYFTDTKKDYVCHEYVRYSLSEHDRDLGFESCYCTVFFYMTCQITDIVSCLVLTVLQIRCLF